jgi:hypothetical protein
LIFAPPSLRFGGSGSGSSYLTVDLSDKGYDANPATTGTTVVTFDVAGLLNASDPAAFPNGTVTHPWVAVAF